MVVTTVLRRRRTAN